MTFPTGVVEIRKCSDEELKTMLDEAREASKHSCKLGRVMEIVAAHRLQQMKDLLTFEKLATWRRMSGFDRLVDGEDNWFHGPRSLPPTPKEYAADLWFKVNELKDAILMPRQKVSNLINVIEQGKLSDEEFVILKRLVETRGREAAQVTVTPVDTVQYCSPSPQTPEPSPDVCINLENNKGRMSPERGELKPPSAGTGLETPGQQCPPTEGAWETGRTTADGFLTAGMGSNLGKHTSPTTERVDTRAVRTTTTTYAASNISFLQQGHKPEDKNKGSEENKQFDPGGKREKPPPWNAAVISIFLFLRGALGHGRLVACTSCFFCLCVSFCSAL